MKRWSMYITEWLGLSKIWSAKTTICFNNAQKKSNSYFRERNYFIIVSGKCRALHVNNSEWNIIHPQSVNGEMNITLAVVI